MWNKHTLCVCCVHVVCMFSISLKHFELCGCMRWALLSNCRATVRQAIVEQPCRTTVRYGAVMQIPRVSHHLLLQCTSAKKTLFRLYHIMRAMLCPPSIDPPSIDCYILPQFPFFKPHLPPSQPLHAGPASWCSFIIYCLWKSKHEWAPASMNI